MATLLIPDSSWEYCKTPITIFMLSELLRAALELVFETRCGVCYAPTQEESSVCTLCNPTRNLLTHSNLLSTEFCIRCGESVLNSTQTICQSCYLYPTPIDYLRSVWSYVDTAESLICAYKYANSRQLAPFLANTIVSEIKRGAFPPVARFSWDIVLPVPSTEESLRLRTFSPVGELVKIIATELKLPYSLLALKVIGKHPAQASLPPGDRLKHIKRKFLASRTLIKDRRILLIDDVITSGASVIGSAIALKKADAKRIDCFSLCRSDLFRSIRREVFNNLNSISN